MNDSTTPLEAKLITALAIVAVVALGVLFAALYYWPSH